MTKRKKPAKKSGGARGGSAAPAKKASPAPEPTHSREAVSRAISDAAEAAAKLGGATPTLPASAPPETLGDAAADRESGFEEVREDELEELELDEPNTAEAAAIAAAPPIPVNAPKTSPKIKVAHVALAPAGGRRSHGGPDVVDIDAQTEREPGHPPHAPPPIPVPPPSSPEEVATRIRELEQRLDRMIDEAARTHGDRPSAPPPPPSARVLPGEGEPTVFDTARELLSSDFYLRKWGRLGMRNRSEEVDDFGFDPIYEKKVQPLFDFLYEKYFRVDAEGVANVPSEGRCLLVANHSGTLPYDGVMIKVAVKREHPAKRDVRWLAEDFIFHFPFLGSFSNRIGAVRACQENAERLLRKDSLVAVFPEGVKGIGKLFKDRYQLQRFGRGGFIKLCLRTGTPIVPVAVVGAEETNPMLGKIEHLSKAMGFPYIPITPTFPWLGPAGLLPAPTKWRITFGEPIEFGGYGAEAADDEILVGRLAERVRGTIQGMLDRSVGERRSVFFG